MNRLLLLVLLGMVGIISACEKSPTKVDCGNEFNGTRASVFVDYPDGSQAYVRELEISTSGVIVLPKKLIREKVTREQVQCE